MREEPSNLFSERLRKTAAFSPMNSEGRQGFRKNSKTTQKNEDQISFEH